MPTKERTYTLEEIERIRGSVNIPEKYPNKNMVGLVSFFFGGFGIHKFMIGRIFEGIVMLLLFWTTLPFFIGIIEAIMIWCISKENFQKNWCRI